jgi:hypothetical protein
MKLLTRYTTLIGAVALMWSLASCRNPTPPEPPPADTCCRGVLVVHVQDSANAARAIPGATVTLRGPNVNAAGDNTPPRTATTDADGNARFDRLCPGKYGIHTAFKTAAGIEATNEAVIEMRCNDEQKIRILLAVRTIPPPDCCEGVVELTLYADDDTPNLPRPLAGAEVSVIARGAVLQTAKTGNTGAVRFGKLCEGSYTLVARKEGFAKVSLDFIQRCNEKNAYRLVTKPLP